MPIIKAQTTNGQNITQVIPECNRQQTIDQLKAENCTNIHDAETGEQYLNKVYKNPRPTKNAITAVMLEHINGNNEWEWCDILFDCTPLEAVCQYHEQADTPYLTDDIKKVLADDGDDVEFEGAKAYYITI